MKLLTRVTAEFLIIDDDPAITKFLVTYLKQKGHSCDALTEGFQTASWLERNQCDVVIVDLKHAKGGRHLADFLHPRDERNASHHRLHRRRI